jgi:hypothetical protein
MSRPHEDGNYTLDEQFGPDPNADARTMIFGPGVPDMTAVRRPGETKLVYDKEQRTIVAVPTIVDLLQRVLAAYGSQHDHIGDSDLDDEQPISLTVSCRLGDVRKARNFVRVQGIRPADFSTRPTDQ